MSTILKALRRLEEDRGARSQRPLREEVTRGSAPTKSRRGRWPLLVALLGLGLAAGAGALVFWYGGGEPEPAQPAELAAASSAEPPAEPTAAAKRPRRRKPARQRSTSARAAAPAAAAEHELPAAALESKVEIVKRPPAQPRIAEPGPAERTGGALARPLDPENIPGRHKRSGSRLGRAPSLLLSSGEVETEAPGPPGETPEPVAAEKPAGSQAVIAGTVPRASRRAPAGPVPEETEPAAERRPETASEPPVVAVAPGPERAAPEPPAASGAAPSRDAEARSAVPEPTDAQAAAEESAVEPASSSVAAASREIARAEVPGLRVERTVWHPIPERRVATIEFGPKAERLEVHEGDAVGPLIVSEIEPSGVVFLHEGVELRRRIGE